MTRFVNTVPLIDLRSDTVTKPTQTMLDRMVQAELGDDGRGDDPTVKQLEALAADRLGKEAGLFLPSGTMSNQVAILSHAGRGGEAIGEADSHIFRSEMGGVSLLAGLFPRPLPGTRGAIDLASLEATLRPPEMAANRLGTALVCMETTHNAAGGAVLPLDHMRRVYGMCAQKGVPVHLDGARLFNAAVALGVSAREIAAYADSATFCVSKGLSAPVGSVLTGSAAFIACARGYRRMLGGNMRQAGLLAACGIVALEQLVDRLAEDHVNARRLAQGLHAVDDRLVDPAAVETNIVMTDMRATGSPVQSWLDALAKYKIAAAPAQSGIIRFVTHRHIDGADIDRVVAAFRELYATQPRRPFTA
ncbi:MAG: Low-specificity L-threonine aldolase [Pseudolabrys sp.]|jgi:threonine aldolase|nr:Low-specificity L-threonine aldolase [Pseudolabrys sp.]